ncbi:MAG: hypothetical protein WD533_06720 [Dehalococcoidia bacterium]
MKFSRWLLVGALALFSVSLIAACGTDEETPEPGNGDPDPTATAEPAFDAEEHFSGETITIYVGFSPGGGYDTSARAVASVMPDHMPGNPDIVVENRPGSGGELVFPLIEQGGPEGMYSAVMHPRFMKRELVGVDVPSFDLETIKWVGAPTAYIATSSYYLDCSIAETWDEVLDQGITVSEGATERGDTGSLGSTFVTLMGGPVELIYGYGGTSEIMAAFDRGELDGTNRGNYTQAPRLFPEWIEDGRLCPMFHWGADPAEDERYTEYVTEDLGRDIPPHVFDVTDPDQGEQEVFTASEIINEFLGRSLILHEDTPQEIHDAWAEAFEATVADPQFVEIMVAAGFDAGYFSPEDTVRELETAQNALSGNEELTALFEELAGVD